MLNQSKDRLIDNSAKSLSICKMILLTSGQASDKLEHKDRH